MIAIEDTLISDDLVMKSFVCNLNKCKGACCVQGDSGAPLKEDEVDEISRLLPDIKPFMNPQYVQDIEQNGFFETDKEGDRVTTCQPSGECNFVVYKNGIASCSIEDAYHAGVILFQKPISCHLYPVRIKEYASFTAVNYHQWDICHAACEQGNALQVPVYRFLKAPLIRRFGEGWYEALNAYYEQINDEL
jgi:hypothetical protein